MIKKIISYFKNLFSPVVKLFKKKTRSEKRNEARILFKKEGFKELRGSRRPYKSLFAKYWNEVYYWDQA